MHMLLLALVEEGTDLLALAKPVVGHMKVIVKLDDTTSSLSLERCVENVCLFS